MARHMRVYRTHGSKTVLPWSLCQIRARRAFQMLSRIHRYTAAPPRSCKLAAPAQLVVPITSGSTQSVSTEPTTWRWTRLSLLCSAGIAMLLSVLPTSPMSPNVRALSVRRGSPALRLSRTCLRLEPCCSLIVTGRSLGRGSICPMKSMAGARSYWNIRADARKGLGQSA